MNRRLATIATLLLALLAAGPTFAGELTVTGAWARSTPPGAKMGAIYLVIDNRSAKSDRLLKLRTPVASSAEVHRTEVLDGIARMREVAVLHIGAGERVEFKPGGHHVMLTDLGKALVEGQKFELELMFEVAGLRKVVVTVRKP
jgi:periplasmic copper chaperone A